MLPSIRERSKNRHSESTATIRPFYTSKLVGVPRVSESPVSFECRLSEIVQLKRADGGKAEAWLTLGEVVASTSTKTSSRTASTRLRSRDPSRAQGAEGTTSKSVPTRCSKCRAQIDCQVVEGTDGEARRRDTHSTRHARRPLLLLASFENKTQGSLAMKMV
jgi:flavin reductase (DIM6/NTAB) family NADH-FMN oxidoreductase RutF